MNYNNFLKFYEENKEILLYRDGLRPAKSVTRNILSIVPKFVEWYKKTGQTHLTFKTVMTDICNLTETGKSTVEDNIRDMRELQFIIKIENTIEQYQFTRDFIDFFYSNNTIEEYIINRLKKIDSIDNINMLCNYILVTLREAIIKGNITLYPDSVEKFHASVPDKNKRIEILNEVYKLYGFKGRGREPFNDDYTPNINYRIISTCVNLKLIEAIENDEYGFKKYILTQLGKQIIQKINDNLSITELPTDSLQNKVEYNINTKAIRTNNNKSLYDDILDELYNAQSNDIEPERILNILKLDSPQPLSNIYASNSTRRDPVKAANAKKASNYLCEFNHGHLTFTSKTNNKNYVEAHHLVPMQFQSKFLYSLDVEANIVALCPICHKMIHHATDEEKKKIITKLYIERIERLKNCNIYIELEDLLKFYYGHTNF